MRLKEQLLVQRRVELRRALVHQQLLCGRLLGQLRQRREQPRQTAHVISDFRLQITDSGELS